jgi:hypothetical protein
MTAFTVISGTTASNRTRAEAPTAQRPTGRPAAATHAPSGDPGAAEAPRGEALRVVPDGPPTADVLQFHRSGPAERALTGSVGRTSGSAALAPERIDEPQRPARALHAVPESEAEDARKFAGAITRAVMEVLAGVRPLQQLAAWFDRDQLAALGLRARLSRTGAAPAGAPGSGPSPKLALVHRAATVRSVHASPAGPGAYEAAVVVADAVRCRAVALRLESADHTGWRVTALEIG